MREYEHPKGEEEEEEEEEEEMASKPLPLTRRPVDAFLLCFFLINIPLPLLFDAQVLLPPHLFPHVLQSLVKWHIQSSQDFLLRDKPPFFKGLVLCELLLLLPLLIANAYAFYHGRQWGRMSGIIYGVYTAATMVSILSEIYYSGNHKLFVFYAPYLVVPLIVLIRLLPSTHPFTEPFPFQKIMKFKLKK